MNWFYNFFITVFIYISVPILYIKKSCPFDQNWFLRFFTKIAIFVKVKVLHYGGGGGLKRFQKRITWFVNSPLYNWHYLQIDVILAYFLNLAYTNFVIIPFKLKYHNLQCSSLRRDLMRDYSTWLTLRKAGKCPWFASSRCVIAICAMILHHNHRNIRNSH